jgi:hypothetical protein
MDNNNAKSLLLEHSEAKVTLYGTYLAIYEAIEEFAYSAYIPFGWGIDRMLQPTGRRTLPTRASNLSPVRDQLSQSRVVQA